MVAGQADWDLRVESDSYCHVFHASGKLFSVIIPGLPIGHNTVVAGDKIRPPLTGVLWMSPHDTLY
jgi:hypothetical protein